jgi:hypothetical protein
MRNVSDATRAESTYSQQTEKLDRKMCCVPADLFTPAGRPSAGKITMPAVQVNDVRIATIFESGGKLCGVGTVEATFGPSSAPLKSFRSLLITRWELDGSPDATFGPGASFGNFGVAIHGLDWGCTSATTDSAGVITLAGSSAAQPAIWQLRSSGDLDTDSGDKGVCSVQLPEVSDDTALDVKSIVGKVRIACNTGLIQVVLTPVKKRPPWPILWQIVVRIRNLLRLGSREPLPFRRDQ